MQTYIPQVRNLNMLLIELVKLALFKIMIQDEVLLKIYYNTNKKTYYIILFKINFCFVN